MSNHDEQFLDEVFDRALAAIEDGQPAEVDRLLDGREHLRGQVEQLVRLAGQVAVSRTRSMPAIAGYTILDELGEGGMGTVYLARQERLGGRPVALKVLPSTAAISPRARQRFHAEANAIAKLRHPHIVAIHDVVQEEEIHAYAMEWVEGASLASVIESLARHHRSSESSSPGDQDMQVLRSVLNSPPEAMAGLVYHVYIIRLGIAIARALEAVHGAGLFHRDVKPSNILLRRDGTPLLSDFGLVREADATITQAGGFAGTPTYASPEQLRGQGDSLDARSDLYSLGVTLYHALAFRAPFEGSGTTVILRQIESGRAPPLRKLCPKAPRDLETIVATAMDPDPVRRYQTADDMAEDLERLLKLQPIRARRAGPISRSLKSLRRNRVALVSAIVGATVALTLAAMLLVYFLVLPRVIERHLTSARVTLLNPRYSELLYIDETGYRPRGYKATAYEGAASRYTAAMTEYDRAASAALLRPSRSAIRVEREVVAIASAVLSTGSMITGPSDEIRELAPLTSEVAAQWLEHGVSAKISSTDLGKASPDDLRSLGLLAYLCFEPGISIAAWQQAGLDLADPPDPFVDAAMGKFLLVRDQYYPALIRLQRAHELLPDAGVVTIDWTDAAVRAGELRLAERALAVASSLDLATLDPFEVVVRDRALWFSQRDAPGDDDRARELFRYYINRHLAPAGYFEYADHLIRKGDHGAALGVYLLLAERRGTDAETQGAFVRLARRCWAKMTPEARGALRSGDPGYGSVWAKYKENVDRFQAEGTLAGVLSRNDGPGPPVGGEDLEPPLSE